MKVMFCTACGDIIAPYGDWQANPAWRWCRCDQAGVRWRDGDTGLLEVTSSHGPAGVRVIGLNNQFLHAGVTGGQRNSMHWQDLHAAAARQVAAGYLFHENRRNCWAVIIIPSAPGDVAGETRDVFFIDFADTAAP